SKALPTALLWDNNVFWNASVNPTRITFRAPGLYLIAGNVQFAGTATDKSTYCHFVVNGTTALPYFSFQDIANQNIAGGQVHIYYFHKNDYIELFIGTTSAVTLQDLAIWTVAITPEQLLE
ncbi:MAG TPA: hypothetical protein VFS35_04665, partial [Terrimicrobiaceae bacterium]|nr:hypothetical protein [Terrimicrobiaceae bacterium]